jgi:hypothetical protein
MANVSRIYTILAVRDNDGTISERKHAIEATSLSQALTIAERRGYGDYYGVMPENYPDAVADGIEFNEADGLLL